MAFTYDITTPAGQVRLEIGDTIIDPDGARPNGINFADNEIAHFLSEEGDHVKRAAAMGCEVLSREWSSFPTYTRLGPQGTRMRAAVYYSQAAQRLRAVYDRSKPTAKRPMGTGAIRIYPPGANPIDG